MGLSNKLSCKSGSFSCILNPHRFFQLEVLRIYFPVLESGLRGLSRSPVVPPGLSARKCRTTRSASCCLPSPVLQPPPCRESSLPRLPTPPLLLIWMNVSSLTSWVSDIHTVRFSVTSGCCWLFLNLLLSFFWLCRGAQRIYLCLHLGRKSQVLSYFVRNMVYSYRNLCILLCCLSV